MKAENLASPAGEPVSGLVEEFRRWMRLRGCLERNLRNDRHFLKPFFEFLAGRGLLRAGGMEVGALNGRLLADYQAHLFERISPKTGEKLKIASQSKLLSVLITFCRFLVATHRLAKDPSREIQLPRGDDSLPSGLLTPREVRKLMALPDTRTVLGFRDRVILEVFRCTGLRMGELLSLTIEDVNFSEGLLRIREGKGLKDRVVPLAESTLRWLREYLRSVRPMLKRNALDRRGCRNSAPLFLSCRGRALDRSALPYKLKMYQRRAGLSKKLTGHSFRHTLATEMLKRGADLRYIQEILGHAQLTTTQRYTHVVKGELKKVHARTHPRGSVSLGAIVYRGSHSVGN